MEFGNPIVARAKFTKPDHNILEDGILISAYFQASLKRFFAFSYLFLSPSFSQVNSFNGCHRISSHRFEDFKVYIT